MCPRRAVLEIAGETGFKSGSWEHPHGMVAKRVRGFLCMAVGWVFLTSKISSLPKLRFPE